MLTADEYISQGKKLLALGNTLEAQTCFRFARTVITLAEAEIPSLSFSGVNVYELAAKFKISNFVSSSDLVAVTNKLESICLLATGNESQTQEYAKFVQRLIASLKANPHNAEIARQLDLKIIATPKFAGDVSALNPFFKSAEILTLSIPEDLDFYSPGPLPVDHTLNLTWGQHAGPNWIFFESLLRCQAYNTILFLECDCFFGKNWLKRLDQFVDSANGFWVSGATYAGLFYKDLQHTTLNHINGGTGLYATGHKPFQAFVMFCREVFQYYVTCRSNLPYDCFLHSMIEDFYNIDLNHRFIWQFIRQHYVPNKLIQNYSPVHDRLTDVGQIAKHSNYAVLHKKTTEKPPVPVFVHLPKCGGTYFYLNYFLPNLLRAYVQNGYDGIPVSYALTDSQNRTVLRVITAMQEPPIETFTFDAIKIPIEVFKQKKAKGKVGPIVGFGLVANSPTQASLDLMHSWCPDNLEFILLLRDPLRREESLFYYLRDVATWENTYDPEFKTMTFEQYLDSDHLEPDWVVRRLVDKLDYEKTLTEQDFEKAAAFVDRCTIVGFQHKYEQFVAAVAARYGFLHNPTHLQLDKASSNRNTTSKKLPINDAMVQTLCRRSPVDARLYHYCLNKFDK